jgi:mannitol/fructose-specific phosphotransferase system IIA component (Ntr-type)
MDMRTDFTITVDNNELNFKAETWQEAMKQFLAHLNKNGFEIDANRLDRLVELATSGSVTVK